MKRIGRYIIRGFLGRGGMGKVYKVELPPIGKIGALKIFAPDELLARMVGRRKLCDLFVREATTIASLRHPHVVGIQDFDELDGVPFFVMDYFADNLGALIGEHYEIERETRILSIDRTLAYARQTLEGLACLHDAGIIHRDIKPYNLLLTPWDSVRICDFGLSKLRGKAFHRPANLNVGSPYYVAPEQEENPDQIGAAADLYPVGVMVYRMLTGRLPVEGSSPEACLPPSRLNPDLDDHWDRWMQQAIAVPPGDRFSSAIAMAGALDDLAGRWEARKAKVCELPSMHMTGHSHYRPELPIRNMPLKVSPQQAVDRFQVDHLWRPRRYIAHDFVPELSETITDRATGLTWQRSGTPFPRTWTKAREYIDQLNQQRFAGRSHWRLPTVDELLSLLQPLPAVEDLCIPSPFDPTQRRIWSADRRSPIAAYYVDSELGFVGWKDFSAPFYVRGVT